MIQSIISAFNVASKDAGRPTLSKVLVKNGFVYATDGHAASRVAVDIPADQSFEVSREYLTVLKLMKDGADVTDSGLTNGRYTVPISRDISFPVDAIENIMNQDETGRVEIKFNPEILLRLYKALRRDSRDSFVTLSFADASKPIVVRVGDRSGIMMGARK